MTHPNGKLHPVSISARRPSSFGACAAAALLAVALSGCHPKPGADVVATVNGHPIMRVDLDKAYNDQLGDNPQEQPSAEQADSLRLQLLGELINYQIVEQRAAKMNLTATPDEVDAKLAEMKAPYTEDQFNQRLAEHHTTVEGVKRDLRRSITYNKLINKEINTRLTVSDADITNYFNAHKAEFNNIETTYHLAQILVTNTPPAPNSGPANLQGNKATNDEEARKKIQALKNRVDAGEDFGTLAMNFSERVETASSGGDMGFISESQMRADPAVYAAITKLKPGQVTDIMPILDAQTRKPAGYAIYKLVSKEPPGQRDLSDPIVQQAIRQQLHNDRSQLLKNAYFEMLRDQAKVVNYFAEQIFKNDAK
jgi:peptidyl-prolyl cis-trans isomerase SurA